MQRSVREHAAPLREKRSGCRRRRAGRDRRGSRSPGRSRRSSPARSRRSRARGPPAPAPRSGAWMCWTIQPSAPSSLHGRSRSTIRSNARREVRTRSTGVISDSTVRIGLIFSAEPSHACAPAIRPPRRRYSSVSIANHSFSSARARRARSATAAASAPSRAAAAAASTTSPWPPQALAESITWTRSARAPSCSRACSAARTVPDMPPAR